MNASDHFKAGQLREAIDEQTKVVKGDPADQGKRLFLFELLSFAGDLERARRQIEAVSYSEVELETAVMEYRRIMDSEEARRRFFRDGVAPQLFAEAPEHVHLRIEAVNRLREDRAAEAATLLEQAAAMTPGVQGKLNDKPFESLRDGDDLFASVLEVMARGAYYWVPLDQIETVTMNPPRFPRDLLWIPARLEMKDNAAGNVFLPALYPASHEHADDQVKLGRMTDWVEAENQPVRGVGLRTFLVGDDSVSLLEWRQLEIQ